MGEVFLAYDERLDRSVALKGLSADLAGRTEALARFEREARTLATLNHPNIVTIFSVEETEEGPYIAMELVEGESLAEAIPARGMAVRRLLELAIPIVDAIASAHERGVVHRDLKPGNVMVSTEGRVKVLDFGLAKLLGPATNEEAPTDAPTSVMTREGAVLGTLQYMSPEQVRGEEASERSDIFALGAVLFEMATGRRPFSGKSSIELALAIVNHEVPPIEEIRPELPHHLSRIVGRCLEKDPRRRYQSAADLRNDLRDLDRELDIGAAVATSWPRTVRAPSHPRWGRGVVATAGTAIAVLVALAVWLASSRSPRTERAADPTSRAIRSLAVLPFDNLMDDLDQDYFVDGMQEALITELAKLDGLRVISRTSAMRYRGTEKTSPEIARELDVDALVEGSVLRAGEQVRITAQLIHGEHDEHLWAESYDRDTSDVLGLLTEVARAVSSQIGRTVGSGGELIAPGPVDPAALELLLKARQAFTSLSRGGFERSLELARQAEALAPEYAAAKAQIATSYVLLGGFGSLPVPEAAAAARAAATEALTLDDTLSEAHTALGWIEMYFEWNWESAVAHFRRALELNPIDGYARHGYGDYLLAKGRPDESVVQLELGRKSDPYAATAVVPAVGHLVLARRYEEAETLAREAIELFPENHGLRSWYAEALWRLGRHEESLAQRELTLPPEAAASLRQAFELGGPEGALRWKARRTVERTDAGEASMLEAAHALAEVDERDEAFAWLERAYAERVSALPIMLVAHPAFDSLRDDPRFGNLLRRMGLGRKTG